MQNALSEPSRKGGEGKGSDLVHAALTKCELVTATLNYNSTPIKWPPSGLKGAGHLHVRMMHTNYIQKCLARLGPCGKSRSLQGYWDPQRQMGEFL